MGSRLAGKVVAVTGASRGLGRWCAEACAREGAAVALMARGGDDRPPHESLDGAVAAIMGAGGQAMGIPCDVADAATVTEAVSATAGRFGRIDVLIANAVFYAAADYSTISPEDWRRQFQVNVHGVFNVIRSTLPVMSRQGAGSIITVTSVAAQRISPYGATKRMVQALTEGFAAEQAANGVAVNALRPVAAIRTPGWLGSRPAEALAARSHRLSPPDSFVEAAVLLSLQTPETCTGENLTDAEVIRRFGAPEELARFKAMNAEVWRESLAV